MKLREIALAAVREDATRPEALMLSSGFVHPDADPQAADITVRMNQAWLRKAELPAGNGTAGARDLARMYALLAQGGELGGVRLVSPESIERFARDESVIPGWYTQCLGYQRLHEPLQGLGPGASAFGHAGAGGNLGFADPVRKVSFGLVKNRLGDVPGGLAQDLVEAIYACL
jgi:CubicO group peptidase (beta-lactamase class C family)